MCTAATYKTKDFYFGRTLDYDRSYREEITITPRGYPFALREMGAMKTRFAMIGMAYVVGDYPLYYDAMNECGLCIAGLNFLGNTEYKKPAPDKDNIAQFELIPWILGSCRSVKEARERLDRINIIGAPFNEELPAAKLHWLVADRDGAITLEAVREGIRIYPNPVGVLTNDPPFDEQLFSLNNYMHLSPKPPTNRFSDKLSLHAYSRGMGALGLPGDVSSPSRFVRASFVKMNSVSEDSEVASVNQFFHILGAVDQVRGCCEVEDGRHEITLYTSCCNADRSIYYYTTYENHRISAIDMHREDLDGGRLIRYPIIRSESIHRQN